MYSPRPTFQNPNFESMGELGKVTSAASLLKIRCWFQIKKDGHILKRNINDWDLPVPKILRTEKFSIGENGMNPLGILAIPQNVWSKGPWRYIFLIYVYKSIALVNELKRLKC